LGRLICFFRGRVFLLATVIAAACGSDTPTTPTPPPVTPDPLKIVCPAGQSQLSSSGLPIAVRYGAATAEGGTPPVQIACTPPSDSTFPLGSSAVTCTGRDSKGVSASCSFTVTVNGPPRIGATNFVAFGDSITAGEITVVGEGGIRTLTVRDDLSYPTDLRASLVSRYGAQTILVANQGVKGEATAQGLARLPSVLLGQYQALLLMEGVNDINAGTTASAQQALSNIQAMVRLGKSRGLRVYLATVTPENPVGCNPCRTGGANQTAFYNAGIRSLASAEGVTLVDVFNAFDLTLLGPDGLHPTAQGYQVIANTFLTAIRTTLEIPVTSLMPSSLRPPLFVSPTRRR
jgi:acyl-CoA thioesterase I